MKAVNGEVAYLETHFEVVQQIVLNIDFSPVVMARHEAQGHGGLYELAEELTDEFEELHKDREWNGDFFDEIDRFLDEKLY